MLHISGHVQKGEHRRLWGVLEGLILAARRDEDGSLCLFLCVHVERMVG